MTKNQKQILILTNDVNSWSTKALEKELVNVNVLPFIASPDDLFPFISEHDGRDRLYFRDVDKDKSEKISIKDFDAAIVRIAGGNFEYSLHVVRQLEIMGIFVTNISLALENCSNKWRNAQLLSKKRVNVPRQILSFKSKDFDEQMKMIDTKLPIFGKTVRGSQGAGVFTLSNALDAKMILQAFSKKGEHVVLQRYIGKNSTEKKSDYRIIVIGAETSDPKVFGYKRLSESDDPRANFSIHHSGEKIVIDPLLRQEAIKAAQAMGGGVIGTDFMEDNQSSKYVCIECNGSPSLEGISQVTGQNVAAAIVEYTLQQCERPHPARKFYDMFSASFSDENIKPTIEAEVMSKKLTAQKVGFTEATLPELENIEKRLLMLNRSLPGGMVGHNNQTLEMVRNLIALIKNQ
jgi:RimK family alpha-L-glutamate ligase